MNQTEKRRKKLLEQTRNLYSDRKSVPAVHPRYKAAYHQLYEDEYTALQGTFGIRTMICILAFLIYAVMDYRGTPFLGITKMQVLESIMQNIV